VVVIEYSYGAYTYNDIIVCLSLIVCVCVCTNVNTRCVCYKVSARLFLDILVNFYAVLRQKVNVKVTSRTFCAYWLCVLSTMSKPDVYVVFKTLK